MTNREIAARKEARDDALVSFFVMIAIMCIAAAVLIAVFGPILYLFLNRIPS